jgi:hypothetical protein
MTNYENFQPLFEFLKLWFIPKQHWCNEVCWEMVEQIDNEMKKTIKIIIKNAKFVFLTCDEVTSMKNASRQVWIV